MNLNQLKYFVTVVEEGSFSAAAKKLYMAQPPISKQIILLEQELNCQLLIRSPKSLKLTDEGDILYLRCKNMIALEEQIKNDIKHSTEHKSTFINVGVVSSVVNKFSEDVLSDFISKNKNIDINVFEKNTYELLTMLENKTIDCAIVRSPFKTNGLEVIKLKQEELVFISRNEAYKGKNTISVYELDNNPVAVYRRWYKIISDLMEKNGAYLNSRIIMDDARSCIKAIQKSDIGAIVPKSAIEESHDFYVCKIDHKYFISDICLIYHKNKKMTKSLSNFIKSCDLLK